MRSVILVAAAFSLCGVMAGDAGAGPRSHVRYYQPRPDPYEFAPFDDLAPPTAVVFRRHTTRCEYPRGFNVTDFKRNLDGIPRGGDALLATGCGTFEPFSE